MNEAKKIVQAIRERNGLTFNTFAEKIGSNTKSVKLWENGEVRVREDSVIKICKTFSVSAGERRILFEASSVPHPNEGAVSKNIRTLRQRELVTSSELASDIDISQQRLKKYEDGYVSPDIVTVQKIAARFGISMHQLATGRKTARKVVTDSAYHLIESGILQKRIKRIRIERGLTMEEAASCAGIDINTQRKCENDMDTPEQVRLSTMLKIANAYNMSLDELFELDVYGRYSFMLRWFRQKKKWTIKGLANRTGIQPYKLELYEAGCEVRLDDAVRIAMAMNEPLETFITHRTEYLYDLISKQQMYNELLLRIPTEAKRNGISSKKMKEMLQIDIEQIQSRKFWGRRAVDLKRVVWFCRMIERPIDELLAVDYWEL